MATFLGQGGGRTERNAKEERGANRDEEKMRRCRNVEKFKVLRVNEEDHVGCLCAQKGRVHTGSVSVVRPAAGSLWWTIWTHTANTNSVTTQLATSHTTRPLSLNVGRLTVNNDDYVRLLPTDSSAIVQLHHHMHLFLLLDFIYSFMLLFMNLNHGIHIHIDNRV